RTSNGTACSTGASSSLSGHRLLQAVPRQSQPILQRLLGAPAELTRRERGVDARNAPAGRVQLVNRRLDPRADVVDAASVLGRSQHAAYHVADIDEVA